MQQKLDDLMQSFIRPAQQSTSNQIGNIIVWCTKGIVITMFFRIHLIGDNINKGSRHLPLKRMK